MSKDNFKKFVKSHPEFIDYVNNNNNTSWQKLYEIYDIYGEDMEVWQKHIIDAKKENKTTTSSLNELVNMAKNIDVDKVQSGVNSLQKALGLFSDLFVSKNTEIPNYKPRAVYKRFED